MIWSLYYLRKLDDQLQRIPKTEFGALAKQLLLKNSGMLGDTYLERLQADGKLRHRKTGPKGKRAKRA